MSQTAMHWRIGIGVCLLAMGTAACSPAPASAGRKPLVTFYEGKAQARGGKADVWLALDSKTALGTLTAGRVFGDYRLHGTRNRTNIRGALSTGRKPKARVGNFSGSVRAKVTGTYKIGKQPRRRFSAHVVAQNAAAMRKLVGRYVIAKAPGGVPPIDVRLEANGSMSGQGVARKGFLSVKFIDLNGSRWGVSGKNTFWMVLKVKTLKIPFLKLPEVPFAPYGGVMKLKARNTRRELQLLDPYNTSVVVLALQKKR
jgi:hypothetical protein